MTIVMGWPCTCTAVRLNKIDATGGNSARVILSSIPFLLRFMGREESCIRSFVIILALSNLIAQISPILRMRNETPLDTEAVSLRLARCQLWSGSKFDFVRRSRFYNRKSVQSKNGASAAPSQTERLDVTLSSNGSFIYASAGLRVS